MATAETESTLVYKDIHGDYQRRDNSDSPPTPTSSDGSLYSAADISVRSTSSSAAFETCSSHQSSSADTSKAATLPNVDGADAAVLRDFDESAKNRASNSSEASDRSTGSSLVKGSNKPHKANDARWEAISTAQLQDNEKLGLNHFKLLKRLGCGDIGSVYLSQLNCSKCLFAMKVMDKRSLASRKKLHRAQIEREILTSLDHPFLPTLYTHFETDKYYCLVMEFCPGGDLHNLRQRQRGKCFTEQAVRFYASEVLLALEYLHMLGIVYRDLKPENILVREDGHIMLSDFDLSLRCAVSPTLVKPESAQMDSLLRKVPAYCIEPGCVEIKPSCLPPHSILSKYRKARKPKTDTGCNAASLPELVAEPTGAKSMSFVGTHEYLAPEIIRGKGHGSAVDWWTFGIFLYELLFGKTPFKGEGNRETLLNVIRHPLRFPDFPIASFGARDLIRGLLVKEPQHRLASRRGATELKQHPFFDGVNWALIRCTSPPGIPSSFELDSDKASSSSEQKVSKHSNSTEHYLEFELF